VGCGPLDVFAGAPLDIRGLLIGYVSGALGGDADDETAGLELAALGDDGTGGDDGAGTYLGAVEDRGAHADEAVILYLASVYDRVVAEYAAVTDDRGVAGVGVQDAAVLDVGPGPYTDGLRVTTQHGPVPYARLLAQVYVPDDEGPRRDPG